MIDVQDVHDGDRNATLETIFKQAAELQGADIPNVTCPCGRSLPVYRSFRCYYCEVFFCPRCAGEHFGENEQ